jgi:sugar lactone lactonase YvrE
MSVRRHIRLLVLLAGLATAAAGVVTPSYAGDDHSSASQFPTRIELPNGWLPEGIAIRHTTAYFGSRADGDIYAADLRTGDGRVIAQGPGTPSVGVKIDDHGLLFVAGGPTGTGRVVDTRTGEQLKSYTFTTTLPSFVNDVVLTPGAAWFTDSRHPQLYRVGLDRLGRPADTAQTLQLSGDYQHVPEVNNANGISRTPDGRALIIVQSATGFLFRVDTSTGHTTRVDLGGAVMANGDGLLLIDRILYVVQNRLNKVAVLKLNSAGTKGALVREITSPDFDIPTTAAAFDGRLYLPNARFTTPPTPDTPYWATAVRR